MVSSIPPTRRRGVAVLAAVSLVMIASLVVASLVLAPLGAKPAFAACATNLAPAPDSAEVPWPQQRLGFAAVGQITDGGGVLVAVVDSGVAGAVPQLAPVLAPGTDILRDAADGRQDCLGHGTAVASIIAAQPAIGVGLRGLAPGARILPIRVSERVETDGTATGDGTVADLAAGILAAVNARARVINLSISTSVDDPALRSAVQTALAAGIVVVAAAGNHQPEDGSAAPVPYPAAYPGVVGVGAITRVGTRVPTSQVGSYVDIVAPGDGVVGAAPGGGELTGLQGTSFAAPFVSATAALIWARWPGLTRDQVVSRLLATADPAPGSAEEYGHGVVDPLRALTAVLPDAAPGAPPTAVVSPGPVAASDHHRGAPAAFTVAAALVGAAVVLAAVAAAVPLGRRRRWRPGA